MSERISIAELRAWCLLPGLREIGEQVLALVEAVEAAHAHVNEWRDYMNCGPLEDALARFDFGER